jgi:hypothetical protein
VNLAAAAQLPNGMPAFLFTETAAQEISYFGPEPDRWRPGTEAELSRASAPDHGFRLEYADQLGILPRSRYDFLRALSAYQLTHPSTAANFIPEKVGTLPYQAVEVLLRLQSAFRSYRLLQGELGKETLIEIQPMTPADTQFVEQSILFYSGWLGHYIGDASQPLHSTINTNGWIQKENPQGFVTTGGIHSALEALADRSIETGRFQLKDVEAKMTVARRVNDPFGEVIQFLRQSKKHVPEVYLLNKSNTLKGDGSKDTDRMIVTQMAAGASLLRDLLYTAWIDSAKLPAADEQH